MKRQKNKTRVLENLCNHHHYKVWLYNISWRIKSPSIYPSIHLSLRLGMYFCVHEFFYLSTYLFHLCVCTYLSLCIKSRHNLMSSIMLCQTTQSTCIAIIIITPFKRVQVAKSRGGEGAGGDCLCLSDCLTDQCSTVQNVSFAHAPRLRCLIKESLFILVLHWD